MKIDVEDAMQRLDAMSASPSAADMLTGIIALRALDLTDDANLFLRIAEAQCIGHAGATTEALALLCEIEKELAQPQPTRTQQMQKLLEAAMAIARGIGLCDQAHAAEALEQFAYAKRIYEAQSDHWRTSALLINSAIALAFTGDSASALALLDEAEQECARAIVPEAWQISRRGTIGINRSGFLTTLGDTEGAISALIAARPDVKLGGDFLSLGHLDFNLSALYLNAKRYGSAAEASEAAAASYSAAHSDVFVRRAKTATAVVLSKMCQYPAAERLLISCLNQFDTQPEGTDRDTAYTAADALASIYRDTGRLDKAKEIERIALRLGIGGDLIPEYKALTVLMQHIFEAINAIAAGGEPEAFGPTERTAIETIRTSTRHPHARRIAELLQAFIDMFYSDEAPQVELSNEDRALLESIGWSPSEFQSMVDQLVGLRKRDDARTLRGNLIDLVSFQQEAAAQENAQVRSGMLGNRGGQTLDVVVPILIRQQDFCGLFEVIEWTRRDLGGAISPELPYELPPFSRLSGIPDDSGVPYSLPQPNAISVRGRSLFREMHPELKLGAEADSLRRRLAGDTSAWWTHMVHRGSLIWALLTPDGAVGGSRQIDQSSAQALAYHFACLPMPLREEINLGGMGENEWRTNTLALARAARAPFLSNEQLARNCFSALPDELANAAGQALDNTIWPSLKDLYGALGAWIIPEALERYLDTYEGHARLLVSVQPELASIPTCLLRTRDGRMLIERATLQYSPPCGLAAKVAARPHRVGPAKRTLSVVNPTDDLIHARFSSSLGLTLGGWGQVDNANAVATIENVLEGLAVLAKSAPPTFLVYIGHLRAGVRTDPSSAAFSLAPQHPIEREMPLRASDLTSAELRTPTRVYLGGCEGAGFGTSLEWSSISAAALDRGSTCVVAHRWPILDAAATADVDARCIESLKGEHDAAAAVQRLQLNWAKGWFNQEAQGIPPHFWAGLQVIGRSTPID